MSSFYLVSERLLYKDKWQIIGDGSRHDDIAAAAEAFSYLDKPYDVLMIDLDRGISVDATRFAVLVLAIMSRRKQIPLSVPLAALADHYDYEHYRERDEDWCQDYDNARIAITERALTHGA